MRIFLIFAIPSGQKKCTDPISYRILLADDHEVLRQILKRILAERGDLEVVGEAADGLELFNLSEDERSRLLDMAIVDVTMPNLGGIEATRSIKMVYPEVKVLILTIHKEQRVYRTGLLSRSRRIFA